MGGKEDYWGSRCSLMLHLTDVPLLFMKAQLSVPAALTFIQSHTHSFIHWSHTHDQNLIDVSLHLSFLSSSTDAQQSVPPLRIQSNRTNRLTHGALTRTQNVRVHVRVSGSKQMHDSSQILPQRRTDAE